MAKLCFLLFAKLHEHCLYKKYIDAFSFVLIESVVLIVFMYYFVLIDMNKQF